MGYTPLGRVLQGSAGLDWPEVGCSVLSWAKLSGLLLGLVSAKLGPAGSISARFGYAGLGWD